MTSALRRSSRVLLAATLVLGLASPATAASPMIEIDIASSPVSVTVGLPVAYPVVITNRSANTLNHASVTATVTDGLTFLGSTCGSPTCDIGQMASGADFSATFYYDTPTTPGQEQFTATVTVSEGPTDNPAASHDDTFFREVPTQVIAFSQDLVRGHSFGTERLFDTGIGNAVSPTNPHGTSAFVPTNAEVLVRDDPPGTFTCPTAVAASCFGWVSSLFVGGAEGVRVTSRWDYSDLPPGMTDKKLRVYHVLDDGSVELISTLCNSTTAPTNLPCRLPTQKQADKDLVVIVFLLQNGRVGGW
jgi:hypothetical protein